MTVSQKAEEVLAYAEEFALSRAAPGQREMLSVALRKLRMQALTPELPPFVHLPLLVYASLRGDDRPAIRLAGATSLLFIGLDLFDDLADGDLAAEWGRYCPAEINLLAATLLCALPQLAISGLDAPPACLAEMQKTLARGLLQMAAGQQTDLALAGSADAGAEEVETSVMAKSGEELAIFAILAALLAGAPAQAVVTYGELGRALGTAGQLASDCYDLFFAPYSFDLANGARTLPIALHLQRLQGKEKAAFLELLGQARIEESAREAVRLRLRAVGDLRRCAFIVEIYCQRALLALERAAPLEPGASGLRAMINAASFFPRTSGGDLQK